jgi:acyl-CoA reductase-like NAD-dependent aldehyde dehydrogenase
MSTDLEIALKGLSRTEVLPKSRGFFYGGRWQKPRSGQEMPVENPATGEQITTVPVATPEDVDAAVAAAFSAFTTWRDVPPLKRGDALRRAAQLLRQHAAELALIDATDCGNPVKLTLYEADMAAESLEYFAGLVHETKGETIPMGPGRLNMTIREPIGVVAGIIPYNHPLLFAATRCAAPLAAGNTMVLKPPPQAPLSTIRLMEIWGDVFPPGVMNVVMGGNETGNALVQHKHIAKVAATGSVATGKAILRATADQIIPVTLELGGKNAFIAYPDVDPIAIGRAAVGGMNFTWAGQSCGSTSRVFLHATHYDMALAEMARVCSAMRFGSPTEPSTEVGALISKAHFERVKSFIASGREEGSRLVCGGEPPSDPALKNGYFLKPTIFADVQPHMRIAREEIFGPVVSVFKWSDEEDMLRIVNGTEYGLTASIWTNNLDRALKTASRVEAGYVWINEAGPHFLGAPFGGFKQSGLGVEESLDELIAYTRIKNVNVNLGRAAGYFLNS